MSRYILIFIIFIFNLYADIIKEPQFRNDDSLKRIAKPLDPNSHINIFIPSIPYSYIAKSLNAGLIRSHDNKKGWIYDLAKSHKRIDDLTYEFEIRKNLKFQDGSEFTIESVIKNLEHFKKNKFLYTNIDKIDFEIKKISQYKFKITLNKKYEMFIHDLARIYFYSDNFLKKFGIKATETGTSNEIPGPYGMGPYILKKGFATGKKQTSKLELEANPYYWNKNFPKIKKITVFTQLDTNEAILDITQSEGKLDLMPIPFNKKIDVILSPYAKLIIKSSTNSFVIFFNLINGNNKLKNKKTRQALNQALNQENLLNFIYKKEGSISPFTASINFDIVNKIAKKKQFIENKLSKEEIKKQLNGLTLNIITQDRFMFLFKGIEYQLNKFGVNLNYEITNSEKDIYDQLLNTHVSKNTKKWDMLIWGDDDWYYLNPWTVFFIYENKSAWSTIGEDKTMDKYIKKFFETKIDTKEYEQIVSKILFRAKEQAYTLKVPSPNKVIAANKEIIFKPYTGGIIPLWEIQITKDHWSLRKNKPYPEKSKMPIRTKRYKYENDK